MIRDYDGVRPEVPPTAFVHETAVVIGKVRLGAHASLWPGVVLRGDMEEIVVGEGTNLQDNTVVHTDHGFPTVLGNGVTVGHAAILHGCRVGDHSLIGMGAILLNGSVVEEDAMVAAGSLLSPGKRVPGGHLAMGSPAKIMRPLTPEEIQRNRKSAEQYVEFKDKHAKTSKPIR
ncbi:MAG: gamma carbonic anhydrase family protein [Elusimicrobia bacterium]|nr:gamma carbonic anhydrase family protein [Elusimicrobiota bacterium]